MQIQSNPAFQIFTGQVAPVEEMGQAAAPGSDADFAAFLKDDGPEDQGEALTGRPEDALPFAPGIPPLQPTPALAILAPSLPTDRSVEPVLVAISAQGSLQAESFLGNAGSMAQRIDLAENPPTQLAEEGSIDVAKVLSEPPTKAILAAAPTGPAGPSEDATTPSSQPAGSQPPVLATGPVLTVTDETAGEMPTAAALALAPRRAMTAWPSDQSVSAVEPLSQARAAAMPTAKAGAVVEGIAQPERSLVGDPAGIAPAVRLQAGPHDADTLLPVAAPPVQPPVLPPGSRLLSQAEPSAPVSSVAPEMPSPVVGRFGAQPIARGSKPGFVAEGTTVADLPVAPLGAIAQARAGTPSPETRLTSAKQAVPGGPIAVAAPAMVLPTAVDESRPDPTQDEALPREQPLIMTEGILGQGVPIAAPDQSPISGIGQAMANAATAAPGPFASLSDVAIQPDPMPDPMVLGDTADLAVIPGDAMPATAGIGGQIAQALPDGPGVVELTLTPEELGRIRFEIRQTGDLVRMVLTAERPETMDHIRRQLPEFLADLRQAGFSGSDISFGQWSRGSGDNTPAWSGAFQDSRQNRQGHPGHSWSRSDEAEANRANHDATSRRNLGLGPGQLAIRV